MPFVGPAFVLLVLAELFVLISVGGQIGAGWTILALVISTLIGLWLLKREGALAFRALRDAVNSRRPPHRELADGALIFLGGLLFVLPGFISDVLGLLCLLPPTRAVLRRLLFGLAASQLPVPLKMRSKRAGPVDPPRRDPPTVIEGEIER
ncbi:FxsA family protein [soil metagenome]